jgi:hypothetical protein
MSEQTNRAREAQNELAYVDTLMRKLAQESPQQAPLRLRQHITEAVQQYRALERSRANRWLLAAAVLFAALALTAGSIIFKRSGHRAHLPSEIMAHAEPEPKPTVLEPRPSSSEPKPLPSAKAKPRRRTNAANPQPVFVTLPFSDPILMSGTSVTIRLALSEAELLAMGVRPIESNPSGSYVADLVLGDDGLPRAIRIVSNNGLRIPGGS